MSVEKKLDKKCKMLLQPKKGNSYIDIEPGIPEVTDAKKWLFRLQRK